MSQSLDRILPPLPKPTIVGDFIPETVLVDTVKPFCDQDLPVLVAGLNEPLGPQKSSFRPSLFSKVSKTEDTEFFAISSLPPIQSILIFGFLHISQTTK